MKFAKGSHRTHRVGLSLSDMLYSDAYVRSKHDVIDGVGPKGTLIIFHSNSLHRQHRVVDSFRAIMTMKYSPGDSFLFNRLRKINYFEVLRATQILSNLPLRPFQRETLKGLLKDN